MISASKLFPAILIVLLTTVPPRDIIATSVDPPPISIIIFPSGTVISIPEPKAAALASSIK